MYWHRMKYQVRSRSNRKYYQNQREIVIYALNCRKDRLVMENDAKIVKDK